MPLCVGRRRNDRPISHPEPANVQAGSPPHQRHARSFPAERSIAAPRRTSKRTAQTCGQAQREGNHLTQGRRSWPQQGKCAERRCGVNLRSGPSGVGAADWHLLASKSGRGYAAGHPGISSGDDLRHGPRTRGVPRRALEALRSEPAGQSRNAHPTHVTCSQRRRSPGSSRPASRHKSQP